MGKTSFGKGFFLAFLAYSSWGVLPLYWKLLSAVDPLHILSFRILFSLALVAVVLLAIKDFSWLTIFRNPKKAAFLVLTAVVISSNWGIYIWAVNKGHTLDASLGYYINPLVSVVLGLLFYREKLKTLQWVAVAIAFVGVTILTVLSGSFPFISLSLALTFGFYGLLKKKSPLSPLESLGSETLASVPISLFLLLFTFGGSGSSLPVYSGIGGLAYIAGFPALTLVLLSFCGVVTMLPLYFFAQGAKQLPLSTLGFVQFISPTLQFLIGLFILGEYFPLRYFAAFGFIWTAVILYVISLRKL